MKRTKDEILSGVKSLLGDNISDEGIALIEDISDTLDGSQGGSTKELEDKIKELEDKVKETDEMWRKKYTDRFFNPDPSPHDKDDPDNDTEEEDEEDNEPTKFDDLFSSGEES